jgi:hypothetical protein
MIAGTVPKLIHVGFNFTGIPPVGALEKVFAGAIDWLRYDYRCWILYTTTDLDTWRDRIRKVPGLGAKDSFFLCEIADYSGYMNTWVWQWLRNKRDESASRLRG